MKPTVNPNWDAGSSIYLILQEINQLIVSKQPIVMSRLVKKHKASGTLATVLKQRGYLLQDEKSPKIFTWAVHQGKALPLSEVELHKYAATLGDDTRELKNQSRLKVANEKLKAEQLAKAYKSLAQKRVAKIASRTITSSSCIQTPPVASDSPKILLDALLALRTFDFPSTTKVYLFDKEYPNVVKVEVGTCEYAEYLHIILTDKNSKQIKVTDYLVEDAYKVIENHQIGFGLKYINS